MIEINLLPGSTKKRGGKRGKAPRRATGAAAAAPKLPEFDRTKAMVLGGWVLGVAIIAWLHLGMNSRLDTLRTDTETAVRDSIRFAALRAQGDSLQAQERAIGQKLQVIQEIDAGRYIWPHILDEVSRALPPYVWVVNLTEAFSEAGVPRVRMEGRAGNYLAIGRYIEDLEASPFLYQVRLISSAQTTVDQRTVLGFIVEASYEEPAPDMIQTVPLFGAASGEN
ncbi:MAG TPA: PilN domain-containing protein [Longimicrobiales bacterium]|nr:PilN domain-containing protein [Longimicrobiales bacterium]